MTGNVSEFKVDVTRYGETYAISTYDEETVCIVNNIEPAEMGDSVVIKPSFISGTGLFPGGSGFAGERVIIPIKPQFRDANYPTDKPDGRCHKCGCYLFGYKSWEIECDRCAGVK